MTRYLTFVALLAALAWPTSGHQAPPPSSYPYAHGIAYPDPPKPVPADGWRAYALWEPIPEVARLVQCESRGRALAKNRTSSASGRYQFIDSTWEWVTGLDAPARKWPVWRQQEAFLKLWDDGKGASHWECPN